MRSAFFVLVLAGLVRSGDAACANDCSGNGRCNAHSACECYRNWMGNDCSQRVCFFGRAFIDTPAGDLNSDGIVGANANVIAMTGNTPASELFSATYAQGDLAPGKFNEAHFYAECSGKGTCDRDSGLCQCFTGYEGEGCTRVACPTTTGDSCSGHGVCLRLVDVDAVQTAWSYNSWDASKTQQCQCDPLYTGIACDQRACPSGDDPVTKYEHATMLCGKWGLFSKRDTTATSPAIAGDASQLINNFVSNANELEDASIYGTVSGASAKLSFFCGVKSTDIVPRALSTGDERTAEKDCRKFLTRTTCTGTCGWQAAVTRVTPEHGLERCITVQGVNGMFTVSDTIVTASNLFLLNKTARIQNNYREENTQKNEVQRLKIRGAKCARAACVYNAADESCSPGTVATGFEWAAKKTCATASKRGASPLLTAVNTCKGATGVVNAACTPHNLDEATCTAQVDSVNSAACVFTDAIHGMAFGVPSLSLSFDKETLCVSLTYDSGDTCTHRNPFALTFTNEYGSKFTTRTIECVSYKDPSYPYPTAVNTCTDANGDVDSACTAYNVDEATCEAETDSSSSTNCVFTAAGDVALPNVFQLAERAAAAEVCRSLVESALEDLPNSALADIDVDDSLAGYFSWNADNLKSWTPSGYSISATNDFQLDINFISNTGDIAPLTVLGQDTEVISVFDVNHHAEKYTEPDVVVLELTKGTTDNAVCSNRGSCDFSTGTCKCFQGFTRHDCSLQNVLAMY